MCAHIHTANPSDSLLSTLARSQPSLKQLKTLNEDASEHPYTPTEGEAPPEAGETPAPEEAAPEEEPEETEAPKTALDPHPSRWFILSLRCA